MGQKGCIPSGDFMGESIPCLAQLLEVACNPWLMASHHSNLISDITPLSLTLSPLPPSCKDPYN